MSALEIFREVARDPAKVAREWKASGKKVIGYRCLYVPEEVIWAAGMLPFPLYGTPEPIRLADSYFQACTCEFVRNLFDHALDGKYEFLDCLALSNTCDIVRRLCDIWDNYIDGIPVHMINNPQKLQNPGNHDFFYEELRRFKVRMEEISGNQVSDEKLQAAIDLFNETRSLLKEIYALRQQDPPLLSGSDALDICMAVSVMPNDQANPLLKDLLGELTSGQAAEAFGPRIMVTGSVLDNPALIKMIEEEDGVVVVDDLCNTIRNFWYAIEPNDDPLEAIYAYMNKRPLCACIHPTEGRLDYLNELVDTFDVEAVIYFNLKYCHPFLYEAPLFAKALKERDIPTNILEVGHDMSGHGQLRTRVQAFIEMLEL
jgi:benzoyl-CoA reductase subunit C